MENALELRNVSRSFSDFHLGEISFDLTGRKSGRGAYVCRSQDCLQKAVRQHQLERAFSAPVSDAVRDALMAQLPDLPAPEDTDAADK